MTRITLKGESATLEFHGCDCVEGLRELVGSGTVDVVVTSPPYNLGTGYGAYDDTMPRAAYLEWTDTWVAAVHEALAEDGSFFLNLGAKPTDPWVPFQVAEVAGRHFRLQNVIHWVKSIAILKEDVGNYPGVAGDVVVGHYKPINSTRFLNDCHEYIFHFTKTGAVPLDRLAVGVPYQDKCLSVSTRVIAKVDEELRTTTLRDLYPPFKQGKKVQLPSYDFKDGRPIWVDVVNLTEPKRQELRRLILRNGAEVGASQNHRFPILKKNTKAGIEVLDNLTVCQIEERQARWRSRPIGLYVTQDLSNLAPEESGPLYNYETGYIVGLYLAEGFPFGSHAFRFAGNRSEVNDPDFGERLVKYFAKFFGVRVKQYLQSGRNGLQFQVDCPTFRCLVEEHVQGNSALTKRLAMSACLKRGKPFLRGLVDGFLKGDGHYVPEWDYYEVGICHNQRLLEDLRTVCLLIGYEFKQAATTATRLPSGKHRRLNFWIRRSVYGGKRKRRQNGLAVERVAGILHHCGNSRREALTMDVEVDIDHHMFFLANGMLTHNSNVTRWQAAGKDLHCRGNTWFIPYQTIQRREKERPHPASFPPALPEMCLKLHGLDRVRLVCDPFMGIGNTAIACGRLSKPFVGFEIDAEYLAEAVERIRTAIGAEP